MITYRLHQTLKSGEVWTSEDVFTAAEPHHVQQAVIGGWLMGQPRWATDATTGARICGVDARGVWVP